MSTNSEDELPKTKPTVRVDATQTWCKVHREAVVRAYQKLHIDFFRDREADIWEPIVAIASVAIPNRVEELKQTALRLSGEKKKLDADETEGLRLSD